MKLPDTNFKESDHFITWMGDDGVVRSATKEGAEVTLEAAKQNTEFVNHYIKEEKKPLIVDISKVKSVSKEARKHFAMRNRETKISALAMITKNMLSKTIGSFFLGLNKPTVPTKLVTSEKEAIEWLNQVQ